MCLLKEIIFPRRLHRLAYFLRLVVADIVTCFLFASIGTMDPVWWWPAVVLISVYSAFFILLPRIRDVGMSGWWLVACLIPVVDRVFGIILLFRSPDFRYGASIYPPVSVSPPTP
jgi:uncharacterized membrane protein YhaH (DUF805 family)